MEAWVLWQLVLRSGREGKPMHWIEQVTGWNPDGGNGSLESALTVALVGFLLMLALGVRRRASRRF